MKPTEPRTSDITLIRAMFDRAGVVYEEGQQRRPNTKDDWLPSLSVTAEDGPKNWGYRGFVAVLIFATDGSLEAVGAWE